jgi:hypothetical protein
MADDSFDARTEAEFRQLIDDLDALAAKWSKRSEQVLQKADPDLRVWFERSRQNRLNPQ